MSILSKKLNSPRTTAITGTVIQALVWAYVAVLIIGSYRRHILQPEVPTGEFFGEVYGTLLFGGSLSLIGFLVSVDAAVRMKYRGHWFFWASIVLSILLCMLYPIGTVLGIGFVIYLYIMRKEFSATVVDSTSISHNSSNENSKDGST